MPKVKEINTLNNMPQDWFTMFDTEKEAIDAADERGEPFVWYYPGNGMYYVADKAEK